MVPVPELPKLPELPRFPGVQLPWQGQERKQDQAPEGLDDTAATSTPTLPPSDPTTLPPATRTPVTQSVPWTTRPVPSTQPAQPTQQPEPVRPVQPAPGDVPITVPPTQQPPAPTSNDCQPEDLRISFVDDPSASGADYSAYLLWMTNISSGTCDISGFPGVDFASGSSGRQVGRSGAWDRIYEPQRFSLSPGQRAAAEVRITHAPQLASCQPTQVSYVKVIAPNTWTGYLFPLSTTACANPEVKQLSVRVSRKVG